MTVFTLDSLQNLLQEALQSIQTRNWRKACQALRCIQGQVGKTSLEEEDIPPLSPGACSQLLLECGRMWNTLLHTGEAESCFRLALTVRSPKHPARDTNHDTNHEGAITLLGSPEASCEVKSEDKTTIIYSWMHTYLHEGNPDKAAQLCHEHFSSLSCSKHDVDQVDHREQLMMLDLAETLSKKGLHSKAVHALTLLCPPRAASPSAHNHIIQARRETILSRAKHRGRVNIPGGFLDYFTSPKAMYHDALTLWETAKWPLEHTEEIIDMLGAQAMEEFGEEQSPSVELMLRLHQNLWNHCGHSLPVARQLFDLIRASCKKGIYRTATLYGKQAVGILQNYKTSHDTDVDKTVQMGQTLCLVAPHFPQDAIIAEAADQFQSWITSLEAQPKSTCLQRSLSATYLCLTFVRKLFPAPVDEMVYFTAKALESQDRLSTGLTRSIKLARADALHQKGDQLEREGSLTKAEDVYTEADHMFAQTIQDHDGSFEFISYGYFLLDRKKYAEADKILLTGYLHSLGEHKSLAFSKTKFNILPNLYQFGIQYSQIGNFDVPQTAAALYFRVLALNKLAHKKQELADCVKELENFAEGYDFSLYRGKVPASHWKGAALYMLGYTYHALGRHEDRRATFEKAYSCHKTEAASRNMEGKCLIKMTGS